MIHYYGEFWTLDDVNWGRRGRGGRAQLSGKPAAPGAQQAINFWDCRAIYVLLHDYRIVYVGKADDTSLGIRLKAHTTDDKAGRWDMFHFYCVQPYDPITSTFQIPGNAMTVGDYLSAAESLLVRIDRPLLNKQAPTIPGAAEILQVRESGPSTSRMALAGIKRYLEDMKADILRELRNQQP